MTLSYHTSDSGAYIDCEGIRASVIKGRLADDPRYNIPGYRISLHGCDDQVILHRMKEYYIRAVIAPHQKYYDRKFKI